MTGIKLVPGLGTLESVMETVAVMGIVQLESLPMAALFLKMMRRPLKRLGRLLGVGAEAMASIPVSCVNVMSVFISMDTMNGKEVVITTAWGTNAIAVFTAHYAFTRAVDPHMVALVLTAKIISAVAALILACVAESRREGTKK